MIKLIVGLGNPGAEYELTRHNAGFWWVDVIARQLGTSWAIQQRDFHAQVARVGVRGQTLWLLKPMTYMNASGQSVAALARYYKIAVENILIVHDELDLNAGQVKLKCGGGHAGHNGLRDIHRKLGNPNYWRLRLGIGHPGHKSEVINWVLRKPSLDEHTAISQAIDRSTKALNELVCGDMERATLLIHTDKTPRPEQPPKPKQTTEGSDNANPNPPRPAETTQPVRQDQAAT